LKDSKEDFKIVTEVAVSKFAEKQIARLPINIVSSLRNWTRTVQKIGIRETRKLPGYHDEPLKGHRKGQRSVRLNRAYRAFYIETKEGIELTVIGVNKHEY
jgi:proteic killer suppression protein